MRRLKTANDTRRFLAYLINQVETGKIKADVASRLTYIANVLLKAQSITWEQNQMLAIEERLNEIEGRLK